MSTKDVTTMSYQYDPTTTAARGALGGDIPTWQQYITNPFGNPLFQRTQAMGTQQAGLAGQNMVNNLMTNLRGQTYANIPGYMQSEMGNINRAETGLQSNALWNAIQQAVGMQRDYSGLLESLPSLQTGSTQTQQQVGMGTWLPTVLGAASPFLSMIPGVGPALGAAARGAAGGMKAGQQQGGDQQPATMMPANMPLPQYGPWAPPGYSSGSIPAQFPVGMGLPISGPGYNSPFFGP